MAETALRPRFEPHGDEPGHDVRLLDNVSPDDWRNPEPADRYHLVVVGAGTAGLVAAAGAAGLGARVALLERHRMGGDCLNFGCVPSKGIIRAARAWHGARTAAERFGGPRTEGDGDFRRAMERMRRLRADISDHDSVQRFHDLGVDVFLGEGRFTGPDRIEVDGSELRFRRALIATGARAAAPAVPGLDDVPFWTNETIFDLDELPGRLAILGAGPIGSEMAQSFARLGSRVTLIDRAEQVLSREDADAAAVVQASMQRDGVELLLGASVTGVERRDERIGIRLRREGQDTAVEADELLVAAGRAPNVESLGLEAAGVAWSRRGVEIDARMRTTNRRIFAGGDVASPYKFTHTADAQARLVLQNALFFGRKKTSSHVVPWVTFTSPEIANVGATATELEHRGVPYETVTVPMSAVDRAVLDDEDEGFLRLRIARGKDRVLGATLVAEHAGEIAGELAVAITAGVGLGTLAEVIHPYPTQAEVVKRAADSWRRGKLTPTVRAIFRWWFRLFG